VDTLCDIDSGLAEAGKRQPGRCFWAKRKRAAAASGLPKSLDVGC
jgi:hypothetical protein